MFTNGKDITQAKRANPLEKLPPSRPDLVAVDASMPRMNGFTFCEAVRQKPVTAGIPIIMLTGLVSQFGRLNGLGHGADAYLTKPFVSDDLVAKIKELLNRSSGQRR